MATGLLFLLLISPCIGPATAQQGRCMVCTSGLGQTLYTATLYYNSRGRGLLRAEVCRPLHCCCDSRHSPDTGSMSSPRVLLVSFPSHEEVCLICCCWVSVFHMSAVLSFLPSVSVFCLVDDDWADNTVAVWALIAGGAGAVLLFICGLVVCLITNNMKKMAASSFTPGSCGGKTGVENETDFWDVILVPQSQRGCTQQSSSNDDRRCVESTNINTEPADSKGEQSLRESSNRRPMSMADPLCKASSTFGLNCIVADVEIDLAACQKEDSSWNMSERHCHSSTECSPKQDAPSYTNGSLEAGCHEPDGNRIVYEEMCLTGQLDATQQLSASNNDLLASAYDLVENSEVFINEAAVQCAEEKQCGQVPSDYVNVEADTTGAGDLDTLYSNVRK